MQQQWERLEAVERFLAHVRHLDSGLVEVTEFVSTDPTNVVILFSLD